MLDIITYFLATGFTWNRFVEVLLNSTAAVAPNMTLGAAPSGPWAHGKDWVVCHTVVTPGLGSSTSEARLYQGSLALPQVSYDQSRSDELRSERLSMSSNQID